MAARQGLAHTKREVIFRDNDLMLVINGQAKVPDEVRGVVLAIGNFDGVHRGHKALISKTRDLATQHGVMSGIMTFEPHPRAFFMPDKVHFQLTPLPEKLRLLEASGLDVVAIEDFNADYAALSADDFVSEILVSRFGVGHVIVGYDFHYGKGRQGTAETMTEAGARHGFGVSVISQQSAGAGEEFSSSSVREKLRLGDVRGAAGVLGHWWRVNGRVEPGARLGRELGFPTANIALARGVELGHGIFAAWVYADGRRYAGAAYFGGRPTVDDGPERLEVFLIDFDGDLYGGEIGVEFVEYVRGDEAFDSIDSLKAQIARDCDAVQRILAADPDVPSP